MMKILKKMLSIIQCNSSCTSDCSYNNNEFNINHLDRKLSHYKLKNKDITTILKILNKRKLKVEKFETEI